MKRLVAIVLSTLIAFSGVVLAGAKGVPAVHGTDIVICSGVNVTTITIGPDGEPVEKVEVCPEGHTIFGAVFAVPDMPTPLARLVATVAPVEPEGRLSRDALSPSARGPPAAV